VRMAAETGTESDGIIAKVEIANRGRADIQHNATIFDVRGWHHHIVALCIHEKVWRLIIVDQPLVKGTDKVRAIGSHGSAIRSRASRVLPRSNC